MAARSGKEYTGGRDQSGFGDYAAIVAVPVVLIAVFLLPGRIRRAYGLLYSDPSLVTLLTMNYVHLGVSHLATNVVVYLLIVPLTYRLSVESGNRDLFRSAFVTFLLAFPLVISGVNVLYPRPRLGVGFSAINMAFLGLLSLVVFGVTEESGQVKQSPALFVSGLGLVAGTVIASTPLPPVGVALLGAIVLVAVAGLANIAVTSLRQQTVVATTAVLVYAVLLAAFVPGETTVNLLSHLLGYALGFLVAYMAVLLPVEWNTPVAAAR